MQPMAVSFNYVTLNLFNNCIELKVAYAIIPFFKLLHCELGIVSSTASKVSLFQFLLTVIPMLTGDSRNNFPFQNKDEGLSLKFTCFPSFYNAL